MKKEGKIRAFDFRTRICSKENPLRGIAYDQALEALTKAIAPQSQKRIVFRKSVLYCVGGEKANLIEL